jgi:hypothetical protein
MQSESIGELAAALSKAQGEFTAVPKGDVNPFFKSKYAGLPDVVLNAAPILSKNGLAISQFITQNELGEDCLKTYLLHSSGQFIEHSMKLYLGKLDSQGMGSATTYARRYSYMSVLGLVADVDDDGNKASTPVREPGEYVNNQRVRNNHRADNDEPGSELPIARDTQHEDPRIATIMAAAKLGNNDFLTSLETQYGNGKTLSAKQLESGYRQAQLLVGTVSTPQGDPRKNLLEDEESF